MNKKSFANSDFSTRSTANSGGISPLDLLQQKVCIANNILIYFRVVKEIM